MPARLPREGAEGEAVGPPAEMAFFGQDAVGAHRFGRQPGQVGRVAVLEGGGDPGMEPDGGAVALSHPVEGVAVVDVVVGRGGRPQIEGPDPFEEPLEGGEVAECRIHDQGAALAVEQQVAVAAELVQAGGDFASVVRHFFTIEPAVGRAGTDRAFGADKGHQASLQQAELLERPRESGGAV